MIAVEESIEQKALMLAQTVTVLYETRAEVRDDFTRWTHLLREFMLAHDLKSIDTGIAVGGGGTYVVRLRPERGHFTPSQRRNIREYHYGAITQPAKCLVRVSVEKQYA